MMNPGMSSIGFRDRWTEAVGPRHLAGFRSSETVRGRGSGHRICDRSRSLRGREEDKDEG